MHYRVQINIDMFKYLKLCAFSENVFYIFSDTETWIVNKMREYDYCYISDNCYKLNIVKRWKKLEITD